MLPKIGKSLVNGAATAKNGGKGLPLSVIGADVRIVGDIITKGEMQIDGQVDGDITCQRLVVGEGGRISGAVTAETVQVHGELAGHIVADTVMIAKTARVVGDVTHQSLEIEAGAFMEGRCLHSGTSAAAQVAETAEAPPPPRKTNGAAHPEAASV